LGAQGGTISSDGHTEVTIPGIEELNRDLDSWGDDPTSVACPVRDILDRVGDKWSVLVILRLGRRTERFRALQRAVGGISQRMLTVTLRGLERDGLVRREVFDTRPPSVAYSLTPLGVSFLSHIATLTSWAAEHMPAFDAARAAYDAKGG
jgi:DNA-binding HxlR family transcriptional regulator